MRTADDLEALAHRLFDSFDALDVEAMRSLMAPEIQGVDEISRSWMRGREALDAYFMQMKRMEISDVKTVISDLHAQEVGAVGVVTLMADQVYRMGGASNHVTAPVTLLARETDDGWKIFVIHAVGLPAD